MNCFNINFKRAFGIHHKFNFIFIIILTPILTGCPEKFPADDAFIELVNNSSSKVVFIGDIISNSQLDNTLFDKFPWGSTDRIDSNSIIQPNSSGFEAFYSENLKSILNQGWLVYYIFDYDSLISIPWNTIRNDYIIKARFDFDTWEQMELADFKMIIHD